MIIYEFFTDLKSAINIVDTNVSNYYWGPNVRVNTQYVYAIGSKYAGLSPKKGAWLYVYRGSSFTVNTGYTADYALRTGTVPENSTTTKAEGARNITEGTTITIQHTGWLLLSVSDGVNDVTTDAEALTVATNGLTLNLIIGTIRGSVEEQNVSLTNVESHVTAFNTSDEVIKNHIVWGQNIAVADGATAGKLNDDETVLESSSYKISVYFPIKPNTTYTNRTSTTYIHFYDYNKTPINVINAGARGTFTTPVNAVYARITTNVSTKYWQINEGTTLLDYTAGIMPYFPLSNDTVSPYNHGEYDLYPSEFNNWYSGLQSSYTSNGYAWNTQYSTVISNFDALMQSDPDYIDKNALGTASGVDSNENVYTLYEYVFKPKNYSSTINTKKVPKIYMDGSIHGFEKSSTFGLYYFLKDLIENWDKNPSLEAIRRSVELHVIPVSNPYGFDNSIYKNGNEVNINRNFDHPGEWVIVDSGSDQNGLAAFDQPESAIIRDWLLAAENDLLCYLNLHTNGQWNVSSYGEMNACMTSNDRNDVYFNRIFRVFTNHIEAQTLRWSSMYSEIQPDSTSFCGKIQTSSTSDSTKGTASAWANTMRNIVAMTLEGFNGVKINDTQIVPVFSGVGYKINSENIGNMVIQMLREYSV